VICLLAMALYGQEKPKYVPTEVQTLRLQNKQKDAIIAKQNVDALQVAFQQAQTKFQEAIKALGDEGEKVKQEQSWPKDLQFNVNDLTYTEPAKDKK
jgi:hypothetical protein